MKRIVYCIMTVFLVVLMISSGSSWAAEKTIKFHIAHWNVPADPNTKVLKAIAADLEKATEGRVKSEISWKALGKPGDYYDALVNGLCDIALFGPTYSPGRFPFSEMFTLPIYYPSNIVIVKAYYALWKKGYFDKRFKDFIPFAVGNHGPFQFMWRDKPILDLAGLKGKKVSAPYAILSEFVEAAGATPVGMPVTEVYVALDTGVLDGAFQIWPAMPVFKMHEVVKYVTEISLGSGPYVIGINKSSYKKLPKEAKEVIDNNHERYSLMMAQAFQGFNDLGKKIFLGAGGKLDKFPPVETKKLNERSKPIFAKWVKETEARGLPAQDALDELYSVLKGLGVETPFAR